MKSAPPLSDSDSDGVSEQTTRPDQDSTKVENNGVTSLSTIGTEQVDVEKKDKTVHKPDVDTSDKDISKISPFE